MIANVKHEKRKWPIVVLVIGVLFILRGFWFWISGSEMATSEEMLAVVKAGTWLCVFVGVLMIGIGAMVKREILSFTIDSELLEISTSLLAHKFCYFYNGNKIQVQEKSEKMPNGKAMVTLSDGRRVEMIGWDAWVDGILAFNNGNQVVASLSAKKSDSQNDSEVNGPKVGINGEAVAQGEEENGNQGNEDGGKTVAPRHPKGDKNITRPATRFATGYVYHLRCLEGSGAGENYRLFGSQLVLGRDSQKCNLQLPEEATEISRVHCRITVKQDRIIITDLGSTNGTFVNERRITANTPVELFGGERIRLGSKDCFILECTKADE